MKRGAHFIRLADCELPDFITTNHMKENNVFTQLVLINLCQWSGGAEATELSDLIPADSYEKKLQNSGMCLFASPYSSSEA